MCELTESARIHLIEQGIERERSRIADVLEKSAHWIRKEADGHPVFRNAFERHEAKTLETVVDLLRSNRL